MRVIKNIFNIPRVVIWLGRRRNWSLLLYDFGRSLLYLQSTYVTNSATQTEVERQTSGSRQQPLSQLVRGRSLISYIFYIFYLALLCAFHRNLFEIGNLWRTRHGTFCVKQFVSILLGERHTECFKIASVQDFMVNAKVYSDGNSLGTEEKEVYSVF